LTLSIGATKVLEITAEVPPTAKSLMKSEAFLVYLLAGAGVAFSAIKL